MVENFGGSSRKERFIGLLGIIYASLKRRVVCMYVCMYVWVLGVIEVKSCFTFKAG